MEELLEQIELLNQATKKSRFLWVFSVQELDGRFMLSGSIPGMTKHHPGLHSQEEMSKIIQSLIVDAENS